MTPGFAIVLVTVMINMMGVGLVWPTLPGLVEELSGGSVSQIAIIYGATAVIFSVMQFLFSPLLGALSDRYGRRPVMLIALLALGMDNILLAFATDLGWMFIARALGGVFGATMSIANAYVADTFHPEERGAGFGLVGAAFGIGFTLGPLLGGVLGAMDLRYPFYCAAAFSILNAMFGFFFLKESLPPEARENRDFLPANPFSSILWIFRNRVLMLLGIALMLVTVCQRGLESIWVIFTGHQYGWSVRDAGISLAIVGICYVFTQGFLVRHVLRILGERKTVVYGFVTASVMYLFLAFNTSGLIGYFGIVPYILGWGCAQPALQAMASRQVDSRQQGRLQGAFSGIMGLSAIAGPGVSAASFSYFTSAAAPFHFPGAFFLAGMVVLLFAAYLGANAGDMESGKTTN
jgi:DHA1 family tetracycline resistance protein-like MFS transporter